MSKKKSFKSVVNPLSSTVDRLEDRKAVNDQFDVLQKTAVCILLELYPDDNNYCFNDVLNHLINYADEHNFMFAYIYHDKDVFEKTTYDNDHRIKGRKGDNKKSHIHFVLCSNLQVPFVISDVFLGVNFPARFIQIVKPKNIDDVILYLSHIKYPNKYRYDENDIETNRKEYVLTLHQDYKPSSAVNFVCSYLANNNSYVSFSKLWNVCLNQNDIPFNDYLKCYNLIKDILKEHNESTREELIKGGLYDLEKIKASVRAESEKEKLYQLATTFGSTQVEINGKMFTLYANQK